MALLAAAGSAGATEVQYREYWRCLPDHLKELARQAYERRSAALTALRTPEAIRVRQAWVSRTFWQLTGGEPQRTPLNTRVVGEFKRNGYRVEKLVYESQPGFVISALLYIPENRQGPFPGVLFQPGHSLNGKAAEPYQKCCQGLAQLGYVVLMWDPQGQGERTVYPGQDGATTRLLSADDEHNRAGRLMMLTGATATHLQTWDAVRSLDVLASHPLVDAKRLASTGQSGGGTNTMLLAAVDTRLAAAAVSCGNTENFACVEFNPPGSVDDAEQNFIGAGPVGFDRWDLLYPLAPKPLLVMASARDAFGTYSPSYIKDGREEFARLRRCYEVLGAKERVEWAETGLPHGLSKEFRLKVYDFFGRVLQGAQGPKDEPPVAPERDQELWVGKTGNVVRDFGGKTPAMLARERKPVAVPRRAPVSVNAKLDVLHRSRAEGCTIETVEVQSAARVWLPGYLFLPEGEMKSMTVMLTPRGRTAHWREGDLCHRLAREGRGVAAFDLRGIGDLSPEVGRGNQFYTRSHAGEEWYAWASLMLGEPLVEQRAADIRAIVSALRSDARFKASRLAVAALGGLTVPATLAASDGMACDLLYAARGLESFQSQLDGDPDQVEPLSSFVPGILASGDLAALRRGLGARYRQGDAWNFESLARL